MQGCTQHFETILHERDIGSVVFGQRGVAYLHEVLVLHLLSLQTAERVGIVCDSEEFHVVGESQFGTNEARGETDDD